ncbi:MAG: nucleoside deaminase [Bryobacteraceae bacterium]
MSIDRRGGEHLRRAISIAVENVRSGNGGPFGAVIVREGVAIAEAVNRVTASHDPTAHAEIGAIRAACAQLGTHDLSGCEIYASCEPCPMCLGAIYWARLSRLYFAASHEDATRAGFDDSFLYGQIGLAPRERSIATVRALAREGLAPFRAWRESAVKIPY